MILSWAELQIRLTGVKQSRQSEIPDILDADFRIPQNPFTPKASRSSPRPARENLISPSSLTKPQTPASPVLNSHPLFRHSSRLEQISIHGNLLHIQPLSLPALIHHLTSRNLHLHPINALHQTPLINMRPPPRLGKELRVPLIQPHPVQRDEQFVRSARTQFFADARTDLQEVVAVGEGDGGALLCESGVRRNGDVEAVRDWELGVGGEGHGGEEGLLEGVGASGDRREETGDGVGVAAVDGWLLGGVWAAAWRAHGGRVHHAVGLGVRDGVLECW